MSGFDLSAALSGLLAACALKKSYQIINVSYRNNKYK